MRGIICKIASLSLVFNLCCKTNQMRISAHGGASPLQTRPTKGLLIELLATRLSIEQQNDLVESSLELFIRHTTISSTSGSPLQPVGYVKWVILVKFFFL